jgi:hypothetical protein
VALAPALARRTAAEETGALAIMLDEDATELEAVLDEDAIELEIALVQNG